MYKKKIIVSSSDSKYFHLLKELHLSLKKNAVFDEFDFGVLDTGMESDNLSYLRDNKVIIKKAIWNVDVPKYKILM